MSACPVSKAVLTAGALAGGLLAASASAQNRTPAPTAPQAHTETPRSSHRDAYVLSTKGQWISGGVNIDELGNRRERMGDGDFLWFRRGGKTWIVDDPATLRRAEALFEPIRALEPEQDALRDRERALDDREQALDDEEERIEAAMERLEPDYDHEEDEDADVEAPPPPPASASDEAERDELVRRRGELREKQRQLQGEQRAFAHDERALDKREEDLEREAEAQLWRLMDELVSSGAAKPAR